MSPNDGATMARKPHSTSPHGACSREEPEPKFAPGGEDRRVAELRPHQREVGILRRQSWNRNSPKPVRSIRFRNCFGMIWSVSTLARSSAATAPVTRTNGSISSSS